MREREMDKKKMLKKVEELGLELIHLQFTDIAGTIKNVSIPASELEKALNNEIMFDGSSIDGFVRIEESDMCLAPDLATFQVFPWTEESREGRFICDVLKPDGTPFEGCPRYILKKTLEEAAAKGYILNVGPECEFFLFQTDHRGMPTLETHDDAGYFDLAPVDLGGNARKEMTIALREMGFAIEASHHEVAPGQHEIDFKYEDALTTADNIMTFKMVVRIIAQKHGLHATFMAKPKFGINGSGMHTNMSLSTMAGENVFYDPEGKLQLSETAYQFLGGLIHHARAFAALTNPTVNSYKRLVPGYEAPVSIAWSASNRSPLIRIPAKRGKSTRIELRNPDPSCNPYLALAAVLKAGLDGINQQMTPPEQIVKNVYQLCREELKERKITSLPTNLKEAIAELKASQLMKEALGSHAFERIVGMGNYEWNEYSRAVSQWELDRYLMKY